MTASEIAHFISESSSKVGLSWAAKADAVALANASFAEKDGKVIEKGTLCKMARGAMVRFMAENDIQTPEDIKAFDRLNYRYCPEHSSQDKFVFILSGKNLPEEHI